MIGSSRRSVNIHDVVLSFLCRRSTTRIGGLIYIVAWLSMCRAQQPVVITNAAVPVYFSRGPLGQPPIGAVLLNDSDQPVPVYAVEPFGEADFNKYVKTNTGHVVMSVSMQALRFDLGRDHVELQPLVRSLLDTTAPKAFAASLVADSAGQAFLATLDFAELKVIAASLLLLSQTDPRSLPPGISAIQITSKTGFYMSFSNDLKRLLFGYGYGSGKAVALEAIDSAGLARIASIFNSVVQSLRTAGAR